MAFSVNAQVESRFRKVLNRKDSTYVANDVSNTRSTYKYLGVLKDKNDNDYKIVTHVWEWGIDNHRATSRVHVLDRKGHWLGNFYIDTVADLPDKIEHNELVFLDEEEIRVVQKAKFENGIPQTIGSSHPFSKE